MAEREEPETVRAETIRRALDWFLHTATAASRAVAPYRDLPRPAVLHEPAEPIAFSAAADALTWLEHEFRNLRTAARTALDRRLYRTTWQLVDAIWPLFLHRGHYAERLDVDRMGLEAARAGADSTAEAKMLEPHRPRAAGPRPARRSGRGLPAGGGALAAARRSSATGGGAAPVGLLDMDRGHLDLAVTRFTEAIAGYRTAGEPRRAARTMSDLGDALIRSDRTAEAVAHLTQARRLLGGEADPYNQARVLILLGPGTPDRLRGRCGSGRPGAAGDARDRIGDG